MRGQPSHENRYCRPCKQTCRHERVGTALCCERCGLEKRPPEEWRRMRPVSVAVAVAVAAGA